VVGMPRRPLSDSGASIALRPSRILFAVAVPIGYKFVGTWRCQHFHLPAHDALGSPGYGSRALDVTP
jgi:hypothetical protein